MGRKTRNRLIVLCCLMLVSLMAVHRQGNTEQTAYSGNLQEHLKNIDGYRATEQPLSPEVVASLELDDYANLRYQKDGETVDLYVGYYNSLEKLSAAHSPLVCFPSQGWEVKPIGKSAFNSDAGTIHYAQMVASKGNSSLLILYWYQAHESTSTEVYRNKLNAFMNKVLRNKANHAFIRIVVPFQDGEQQLARNIGESFLQGFYGKYKEFVAGRPSLAARHELPSLRPRLPEGPC